VTEGHELGVRIEHAAVLLDLVLQPVPDQQRPQVVGRHEEVVLAEAQRRLGGEQALLAPRRVHDHAAAVGVGVGADQQVGGGPIGAVGLELRHGDGRRTRVAGIRLLLEAGRVAEGREQPVQRIQPADRVEVGHAELAEDAGHRAAAGAVEGGVRDLERRRAARGQQLRSEQEGADLGDVGGVDVQQARLATEVLVPGQRALAAEPRQPRQHLGRGRGQVHRGDVGQRQLEDVVLEDDVAVLVGDLRAVRAGHLEAVVAVVVVARRDEDADVGVQVGNREGHLGVRHRLVEQIDGQPVGQQHLGHGAGEVAALRAAVEPDDRRRHLLRPAIGALGEEPADTVRGLEDHDVVDRVRAPQDRRVEVGALLQRDDGRLVEAHEGADAARAEAHLAEEGVGQAVPAPGAHGLGQGWLEPGREAVHGRVLEPGLQVGQHGAAGLLEILGPQAAGALHLVEVGLEPAGGLLDDVGVGRVGGIRGHSRLDGTGPAGARHAGSLGDEGWTAHNVLRHKGLCRAA